MRKTKRRWKSVRAGREQVLARTDNRESKYTGANKFEFDTAEGLSGKVHRRYECKQGPTASTWQHCTK